MELVADMLRAEMKRLMDHCVNGVLKLIKEQVEKVIAAKGQRVWVSSYSGRVWY